MLAAAPAPTAASALPRSCGATPEAIFIMSTGRTGSTSLLETVNSLPGVEVMGENSAFWSTIVRVDETATSSKRYLSGHMSAFYHTKEVNRSRLLEARAQPPLPPPRAARMCG